MRKILLIALGAAALAGCEQLGIETPAQAAAAKEAEGRAIGGGCRHSGRSLEDCYALNKRASKAAIFTGWRDMDAYMRENNIDIVPPAGVAAKSNRAETPSATETAGQENAPSPAEGGPPPGGRTT